MTRDAPESRGPCGHEQETRYGHLVCGRTEGHDGPHLVCWRHATIAFGWPTGTEAALLPIPSKS